MITAKEAYAAIINRREARESKFHEILNFVVSSVCHNELVIAIKTAIQEDQTEVRIGVDELKQLVVPYGRNGFVDDWNIHEVRVISIVVDEIRRRLEKFGYEVFLTDAKDALNISFDDPEDKVE